MKKLKKKNLFIEINDQNFVVAFGEYDDELNFKIIEKDIFSPSGMKDGKIIDLNSSAINLKKTINKIENKSSILFSDANVILNQNNFDCINVSGFKKLNGNQILSEDISFILNDIKSKLVETEKNKTIIHLFNTKFLLDNKDIKNLPIGLYGDFYSHQLTFFLVNNNELKNIKTLLNKCNLSVNKIILKNFSEGINIVNQKKNDTFIKIQINKNETELICFYNSAFSFFQKFNFGSDIILKDISKVCSLNFSDVYNIVSDLDLNISNDNIYIDKKYFKEKNFRKISVQHIKEISFARIEEVVKIIFNKNKNLINLKLREIPVYLNFNDDKIAKNFKNIFVDQFKGCKLNYNESINEDYFTSIKIFGELLSKGWMKEAIPFVQKKSSWISRIFSNFFD